MGKEGATKESTCKYQTPSGTSYTCPHPPDSHGKWCIFHRPNKKPTKDPYVPRDPFSEEHATDEFSRRLYELAVAGEMDWTGFCFPYPLEFRGREVEKALELGWAVLPGLYIRSTHFAERLNLVECRFEGPVVLDGCVVREYVDFSHCRFQDEFAALGRTRFEKVANFAGAQFFDVASFRCRFEGEANFGGAYFAGRAIWQGNYSFTVSMGGNNATSPPHKNEDYNAVFNNQCNLMNVDFAQPAGCRFENVNMTQTTLSGTSLRGVKLYNAEFYQPDLERNGLLDEVQCIEIDNDFHWQRVAPKLEATYRNTRLALEESKDYMVANDFYIGEMDVKRRQLPGWKANGVSWPALYSFVSRYGTSPGRASAILGGLSAVYAIFLWMSGGCFSEIHLYLLESFRVMTRVRTDSFVSEGIANKGFADLLIGILGPIQIAISVFAVRNRLRR